MTLLFFIGPAGSGKTTLVGEFGRYLLDQGLEVRYVNLDCAVEGLGYRPDLDVRSYFTLSDIMRRYGLGPNGALVKSMELLLDMVDEFVAKIEDLSLNADYVLIDTPGQLELVIFHDAVLKIMERFINRSLVLFLIPADLIRTARDIVFLSLLTLTCRIRLNAPLIAVISKADVLNEEVEKAYFGHGLTTPKIVEEALQGLWGVEYDLTKDLALVIERYEKKQRIVKVSAKTRQGFDDLHSIIHEAFCTCGELA